MAYTISNTEMIHSFTVSAKKPSFFTRFFQWATNEDEENHIAWVGVSVISMSAVFFPVTMSLIMLNGASFVLIITAMIALALVVTTNLASMPTRFTIPFFFLGILIDIAVIVASFVIK